MTKAFRILELILAAIAVAGLAMKLALLGGSILLFVGLGLLSVLYFAGGYFQAQSQPAAAESTALRIWSGILFSMATTGLLGTLMFWDGFSYHLQIGLLGSSAVLFWLFSKSQKSSSPASTVLRRSAAIATICAAVWLTPQYTFFRIFHRDDPQLVEKWTLMHEHPDNPTYQADFDAYSRQKYASSK